MIKYLFSKFNFYLILLNLVNIVTTFFNQSFKLSLIKDYNKIIKTRVLKSFLILTVIYLQFIFYVYIYTYIYNN